MFLLVFFNKFVHWIAMIIRIKIVTLLLFFYSLSQGQNIAIGQWRVHLPYSKTVSVAETPTRVYCASGSGLFFYDKTDNHLETLSKVNGLSDISISKIRYNSYVNALLIAYNTTNLDIIKDNRIINLSDIKRKEILGKKSINNIFFKNEFAYLSCGFGVVVVNMLKMEIKDTYYMGPVGNTEVLDFTMDNQNFYAATSNGIYTASVTNPDLVNFNEWSLLPGSAFKNFNTICTFSGKLYANYTLSDNTQDKDTLYVYDGITWSYFNKNDISRTYKIEAFGNYLSIRKKPYVYVYAAPGTQENFLSQYGDPSILPQDASFDPVNKVMWLADGTYHGLIRCKDNSSIESIIPNGPASSSVVGISSSGEELYVASGGRDASWTNIFNGEGIFYFKDEWLNISASHDPLLNGVIDIMSTTIDPANNGHVWINSWGSGLLEMQDQKVIKSYDNQNSTLVPAYGTAIRIGGSAYDSKGNLWVSNSNASIGLHALTPDRVWKGFYLGDSLKGSTIGQILIDQNDNKWMIRKDAGIAVFNDNGTLDDKSDDKMRLLTNVEGRGKLLDNAVNCMALDDDGPIWVGTNSGLCIFFSPGNLFSGGTYDAQQILIQQDGHNQYLLEGEVITSIYIDGANRKWIGTKGSGAYLFSADGTKEIYHFTSYNSPLLSDNITAISILGKTGEVFFGTDAGIISFKGTATEGEKKFTEVRAYPNPVREGYEGPIAVRGLVKNASVKFTDIAGNIVFETKALGGQAIWDGKNFSGQRMNTGVYLVFCTDDEGNETLVTKILFIN